MTNRITLLLISSFFALVLNAQNGVWTWMKGDTVANSLGVYGVQTVPSSTAFPPALYEAAEWTDLNGNFWIFGGFYQGFNGGYHSDLWRYEPATNN